jgi:hypothetical protein
VVRLTDLTTGEPGHSPDAAGCIDTLTPRRSVSPTSTRMAPGFCLAEVERWASAPA